MSERVVIISDTHLGRPNGAVRSADELAPIWRDARADRIILNGDTAEVHHPKFKSRATCELMRLVELCGADGVEVDVLSGNHDPWLSVERHTALAGGSVFVTHGDVLHPSIAPWTPSAALLRDAYNFAINLQGPDAERNLEARMAAARHASYAEWEALEDQAERHPLIELLKRPWAVVLILDYWRRVPRLAAEFLAEHAPQARFMVFGHTHRAGVWRIDGRTLINTGSFDLPSRPRAVTVDGRTLEVHKLRRRRGAWRMDERAIRRFDVHEFRGEAAGGALERPA